MAHDPGGGVDIDVSLLDRLLEMHGHGCCCRPLGCHHYGSGCVVWGPGLKGMKQGSEGSCLGSCEGRWCGGGVGSQYCHGGEDTEDEREGGSEGGRGSWIVWRVKSGSERLVEGFERRKCYVVPHNGGTGGRSEKRKGKDKRGVDIPSIT